MYHRITNGGLPVVLDSISVQDDLEIILGARPDPTLLWTMDSMEFVFCGICHRYDKILGDEESDNSTENTDDEKAD